MDKMLVPRASILTAMALFGMAHGCNCGKAPDGAVDQCESSLYLPPSVSTDILFVIDNSHSMREEQQKVIDELNTFIETIANAPVKNDFQIGVITTSVTQNVSGCSSNIAHKCDAFTSESGRLQRGKTEQGNVISSNDKLVLSSLDSDPDFLTKARRLIGQGLYGSGQEMGLEAARLALSDPLLSTSVTATPSGNNGFLRKGSQLLVVIVSDEDDCSDPSACANPQIDVQASGCSQASCLTDADCAGCNPDGSSEGCYCLLVDPFNPQEGRKCSFNSCDTSKGRQKLADIQSRYIDFFNNLDDGTGTGRKREVFLAVIGAVNSRLELARCKEGTDEANGIATRYKQAVDLMGEHGLIDSICNASYHETLTRIATLVSAPQTIDLARAPPDGHLLVVDIERSSGEKLVCKLGHGFDFEPGTELVPARLTFTQECRLRAGDNIKMKVICAG